MSYKNNSLLYVMWGHNGAGKKICCKDFKVLNILQSALTYASQHHGKHELAAPRCYYSISATVAEYIHLKRSNKSPEQTRCISCDPTKRYFQ